MTNTLALSGTEDAVTKALDSVTGLTEDERKAIYEKWLADDQKNAMEAALKADKDRHDEQPDAPADEVPAWVEELAEAFWRAANGEGQVDVPEDEEDTKEAAVDMALSVMEMAAEATSALIEARRALLKATLELNDAKARYEDGKRDAYMMNSVTGKNAEEREARLASLLEVQIHNIRRAEAEWLKAKVEVECCEDSLKGMDRVDRHHAGILDLLNR